jgi:hypothetical protein
VQAASEAQPEPAPEEALPPAAAVEPVVPEAIPATAAHPIVTVADVEEDSYEELIPAEPTQVVGTMPTPAPAARARQEAPPIAIDYLRSRVETLLSYVDHNSPMEQYLRDARGAIDKVLLSTDPWSEQLNVLKAVVREAQDFVLSVEQSDEYHALTAEPENQALRAELAEYIGHLGRGLLWESMPPPPMPAPAEPEEIVPSPVPVPDLDDPAAAPIVPSVVVYRSVAISEPPPPPAPEPIAVPADETVVPADVESILDWVMPMAVSMAPISGTGLWLRNSMDLIGLARHEGRELAADDMAQLQNAYRYVEAVQGSAAYHRYAENPEDPDRLAQLESEQRELARRLLYPQGASAAAIDLAHVLPLDLMVNHEAVRAVLAARGLDQLYGEEANTQALVTVRQIIYRGLGAESARELIENVASNHDERWVAEQAAEIIAELIWAIAADEAEYEGHPPVPENTQSEILREIAEALI